MEKVAKKPPVKKKGKSHNVKTPLTKPKTAKQELIIAAKTDNPNSSLCDIARLTGTSHPYVHEVLKRYGMTTSTIEDYQEYELKVLYGIKEKIIASLKPEDYAKASLQQKLTGYGIITDKIAELSGKDKSAMPLVIINKINLNRDDIIEVKDDPIEEALILDAPIEKKPPEPV